MVAEEKGRKRIHTLPGLPVSDTPLGTFYSCSLFNLANTVILDVGLPEQRIHFCDLSHQVGAHFVMAAPGNSYRVLLTPFNQQENWIREVQCLLQSHLADRERRQSQHSDPLPGEVGAHEGCRGRSPQVRN